MSNFFHRRPTALSRHSITFRLIAGVLAVELVASVLAVALSFGFERHTHFRAFDVLLHGRADSILGAVQGAGDPANNIMLVQADLHLPKDDIYVVYGAKGRLLGRSPNWQGIDPNTPPTIRGIYLERVINGAEYRILRFEGTRIVDASEPGGGTVRPVTIFYGARTERVWEGILGTVEFYAGGSALLLLVTGPLIAWLLHRGLLPLRQLATLASGVSVNAWHFDPPTSARATPELAPLTLALESVLQRLEQSFLQQRAFVSDAAHELKTAVAVVKSSLQLLAMRRRSVEEYKTGLERCLSDCSRLEELVAKMLTLARQEGATAANGPAQAADLTACLRQNAAQLATVAEQRGVRLTLPADAAPVLVGMSADDCSLVLSNVLLNALQHSPAGSEIEARLAAGPDAVLEIPVVVLEIEDHGDGIDPAALPHVFERFYRGDPSRTRNTGGTGLGLAICKAAVERARGSISIASQPRLGTTVTVRLPVVAPAG